MDSLNYETAVNDVVVVKPYGKYVVVKSQEKYVIVKKITNAEYRPEAPETLKIKRRELRFYDVSTNRN